MSDQEEALARAADMRKVVRQKQAEIEVLNQEIFKLDPKCVTGNRDEKDLAALLRAIKVNKENKK